MNIYIYIYTHNKLKPFGKIQKTTIIGQKQSLKTKLPDLNPFKSGIVTITDTACAKSCLFPDPLAKYVNSMAITCVN